MAERTLTGVPASPGLAAGTVSRLDWTPARSEALPDDRRAAELANAHRALEAAAVELEELAARLGRQGRSAEAQIVDTGALMARDPSLAAEVELAVLGRGEPAPAAVLAAAEAMAATLAAIDDETLAARADDVRSLGRRAARLAAGAGAASGSRDEQRSRVLVAPDLGPADVAELEEGVLGVALASGGVTAHAAIVARSLGLPMVVGLGDEVLQLPEGEPVVLDGGGGRLVLAPSSVLVAEAEAARSENASRRLRDAEARHLESRTADGRRVWTLANVASSAELEIALSAGAEGIGLLRTELAFLDAAGWPGEEAHLAALLPILERLSEGPATVRLLDFGGDKTPPFLAGTRQRGVELLLAAPEALRAQLKAALRAAVGLDLRLLIPMVTEPAQVQAVRDMLRGLEGQAAVGAMVEVPAAVTMADRIAPVVDFFSIGTNDLTQFQLGLDRGSAGRAPAHHPAVLRLVARTVEVAGTLGIPVAVCGEAASDLLGLQLFLGLGVNEVSVGAARVGVVRDWLRALDYTSAARVAQLALQASNAEEVEAVVRSSGVSASGGEAGDAGR
jgi:phosphoenolpyruvate-protein kinase (PTS system EI component)